MSTRYKIRQKLISIGDDFWIENHRGEKVYKVDGKALRLRKTLEIAPLRDKWNVDVKGGNDLVVQGNILDLEYDIKQGRKKVAEVSKKWFTITDTYGVEIAAGQNDILILAIAIAIDMMAHDEA